MVDSKRDESVDDAAAAGEKDIVVAGDAVADANADAMVAASAEDAEMDEKNGGVR